MSGSSCLNSSFEFPEMVELKEASSSTLAYLSVQEDNFLIVENFNCGSIFEKEAIESIFCLKSFFDPADFKIFLKEVKKSFVKDGSYFTSFQIETAKNNLKWICLRIENLTVQGKPLVRCGFREVTEEKIQNGADKLRLKLWELHARGRTLRELNQYAAKSLKNIFAAEDAFCLAFNPLLKNIDFFFSSKKFQKLEKFVNERAPSCLSQDGEDELKLFRSEVEGLEEVYSCNLLSYQREEGQPEILGLLNIKQNTLPAFFKVAKQVKEVFINIVNFRSLNEEKVRNDKKMKIMAETAKVGIWDWNLFNNTFAFDDTCFKILGYKSDDLPRDLALVKRLVHPLDLNSLSKAYFRHAKGEVEEFETRLRLKNSKGEYIPTLCKGRITKRGQKGEPLICSGIHYDLSKLEKMQDEIKQKEMVILHQEKLATLGELAASVAHEIKTPLTIIAAATELMKLHFKEDEKAEKPIRMQEDGIARIVKVVDGLRAQARTDNYGFRDCELNEIVGNCINFLSVFFAKSNLKIDYVCSRPYTKVYCDPMQIQQVIMNLMNNAKHAIGENEVGRLIVIESYVRSGRACVSVKDFGKGVPLENADKIFESFFTTKVSQKGTGLGLSISKKIMLEHRGDLVLENPGMLGARFTLSLPVTR